MSTLRPSVALSLGILSALCVPAGTRVPDLRPPNLVTQRTREYVGDMPIPRRKSQAKRRREARRRR